MKYILTTIVSCSVEYNPLKTANEINDETGKSAEKLGMIIGKEMLTMAQELWFECCQENKKKGNTYQLLLGEWIEQQTADVFEEEQFSRFIVEI